MASFGLRGLLQRSTLGLVRCKVLDFAGNPVATNMMMSAVTKCTLKLIMCLHVYMYIHMYRYGIWGPNLDLK